MDYEITGTEITTFKPRHSKVRNLVEAVIGAALIIVFVSALLLLAIK